jgi:hypothetical protein
VDVPSVCTIVKTICWNGFLHALLGSLHILELGGIATRGL